MSSAASAATPPLASTCQASRVSPLENSRLVRALYAAPTRPSSVEVTKKAPSVANHQPPPPTKMTAPTAVAANAPDDDSAPRRYASPAMAIETTKPTATRAITRGRYHQRGRGET